MSGGIKKWIIDPDDGEQSISRFAKELFAFDWIEEYHRQDDIRIFELNMRLDDKFRRINFPNNEYATFKDIPIKEIRNESSVPWIRKWFNHFIVETVWIPSIDDYKVLIKKNEKTRLTNIYECVIKMTFTLKR